MPKKNKKSLEEQIIFEYTQGESDLKKIGKKYKITSKQVMEILEINGVI